MAFQGSNRFELVKKLGEGGMGVVYEAVDRERDMRVALKTLRDLDASSLYRFKREFRALSDISHPNIIGLFELVSEADDWFFTMELIEGADFLGFIRPDGVPARPLTMPSPASDHDSPVTLDTRVMPESAPADGDDPTTENQRLPDTMFDFRAIADEHRLRRGFAQLAQALHALHRAGMVHRDLKPSNVRVTPTGRVVLMDFGIVAELSVRGDESSGPRAVGTPAYMAPEQAAGEPPSAAADWYGFGVVLFLALTGRLPFTGRKHAVMLAKQTRDPPSPHRVARHVPEDLAQLCTDLLARDPAERPPGHEVLARLGSTGEDAGIDATTVGGLTTFVGRAPELSALHAAYDRMRRHNTVAAFVVGVSGMGKSTLVRRFLHELEGSRAARDLPVVLRGRCHERESLPFKAFDTVVDDLSHFLLGLAESRVESLLPDEVDLLTRLFPVLRRVPGIQTARPLGGMDPQELRVRAFSALRELLRAIAAWRPLVLYIDDLQWADADSLELLIELTREPAPPRALFVAAIRAENLTGADERTAGVARLMEQLAQSHEYVDIELGPLSGDEQRQLVERLLGAEATPDRMQREFWRDSAGSPFFLGELVRFAQEVGEDRPDGAPALEDVLMRRAEHLPAPARALLEAVAVAGEPMSIGALAEAVDLNAVEAERAAAVLRVGHMARAARHGKTPWLTAYHDRVRETVAGRLPPERLRDLHQRIAQALERSDEASVDSLARHWLAAGDPHQARGYLVSAAQAAAEKLAFGRAADLYQAALELVDEASEERRPLLRAMARALATAGRYYDAAGAYRAAADGAEPDEVAELARLSADCMLRSGHIVEGLEALRAVMADLGVRVAATSRRALLSLVWQRARAALRGLRYTPRAESEIAARDLARLDTLYAASTSLGMIDHIRGAAVQTRHLLGALKFGEERRVCRAMAIEAVFRASFGGRGLRKAEKISREVEAKARRIGEPYSIGVSQLATGAVNFFSAQPRRSAAAFGEAERIFATECIGADWERLTAAFFHCQSQVQFGEIEAAREYAEKFVREAAQRKNAYAHNLFRAQPNTWRLLIADEPERALAEAERGLDGWPEDAYYLAHNFSLAARTIALLYQRRHRELLDQALAAWPDIKRSMIVRIPWALAEYWAYNARAAFELDDRAVLGRALRFFDSNDDLIVLRAAGSGFRGALAARGGDATRAEQLLVEAIRLFDEAEFNVYATAYRYRLGELTGGTEGEHLQREAVQWFDDKGVVNPARWIEFHAPPFEAA